MYGTSATVPAVVALHSAARGSEATGGCDPLDVGRVHEPVAVRASGRRSSGQQQPWNGGGIDCDAATVHEPAHDRAAVLGLPRWPGEVGDDQLAVVGVQIRSGQARPLLRSCLVVVAESFGRTERRRVVS